MNQQAYNLGAESALMEKLGQIPEMFKTTLRSQPSWLARLRRLLSGAGKARTPHMIPAAPEVQHRIMVDSALNPTLPTSLQTSSGMLQAPRDKAIASVLKPQQAPPLGTLWTKAPGSGGQRLVATPREPAVYAPLRKGMPAPLSARFEGWGF
jgi:hypothetical protein